MNVLDTPPAPADATDDVLQRRAPAGTPPRTPRVRTLTSEQLFADFPEVQITHGDAIYRLRQTALGKLILTK